MNWLPEPTSEGFWFYSNDEWPFRVTFMGDELYAFSRNGGVYRITKKAFPGLWLKVEIPEVPKDAPECQESCGCGRKAV